jgi:hypothetical protein
MDKQLHDALLCAQEAFWSEIGKRYAHIKTRKSIPPAALEAFDSACAQVVSSWLERNAQPKTTYYIWQDEGCCDNSTNSLAEACRIRAQLIAENYEDVYITDANNELADMPLTDTWELIGDDLYVKRYFDGKAFIEATLTDEALRLKGKVCGTLGGIMHAVEMIADVSVSALDPVAARKLIAEVEQALHRHMARSANQIA